MMSEFVSEFERETIFATLCSSVGVNFTYATGAAMSMDEVTELLHDMGFFTQPASTRFHGAYEGGLFDHSYRVATELLKLTDALHLDWERRCSPVVIGLFHDLCKVDNYQRDTSGEPDPKFKYNDEPSVWGPGHGSKSVAIASTLIQLTPEEVACIRYHMGAYEKDEWDNLDVAIRRFNNVLWTHTADMMASKFYNT